MGNHKVDAKQIFTKALDKMPEEKLKFINNVAKGKIKKLFESVPADFESKTKLNPKEPPGFLRPKKYSGFSTWTASESLDRCLGKKRNLSKNTVICNITITSKVSSSDGKPEGGVTFNLSF